MITKNVHLYVFDGLSDWEASFAIAAINNPQWQKNPGRYQVKTVALSIDTVVTVGGLRIQPDMTLDELSPAESAMLILPGGGAWDEQRKGSGSSFKFTRRERRIVSTAFIFT